MNFYEMVVSQDDERLLSRVVSFEGNEKALLKILRANYTGFTVSLIEVEPILIPSLEVPSLEVPAPKPIITKWKETLRHDSFPNSLQSKIESIQELKQDLKAMVASVESSMSQYIKEEYSFVDRVLTFDHKGFYTVVNCSTKGVFTHEKA